MSRVKLLKLGAIAIAVAITLIGIGHFVYAGIDVLGTSSVASLPNNNESNQQALFSYLNPDNNTIGGPIAYFPFSLPDSHISVALIPRGSHITMANNSVSAPMVFGADFGLALLNGYTSPIEQTGFTVNSVYIKNNDTIYSGKVLQITEVSSGTTAFVNNWEYGSAYRIMAVFFNHTNAYLSRLNPGLYSLYLNVSLYYLHLLYRNFMGSLVLSMPWALVKSNFSGASYGYFINPYS